MLPPASCNPPRKAKRPIPPELLASGSDEDIHESLEDEFDEGGLALGDGDGDGDG
jgi:hypothetical protein